MTRISWIGLPCTEDEVGQLALLDRAQAIAVADERGGDARGGAERIHRRYAALHEELKLPGLAAVPGIETEAERQPQFMSAPDLLLDGLERLIHIS